ncbi:class I SAM-dependent methyltransferase [Oceanobacillus kapialis]|uniref:Class I SAM-dependent methyltransferase n=1 Tax=Oceanobacillus kapialis TaxID=481353 RepID=A0ABW5PX13_9BACI
MGKSNVELLYEWLDQTTDLIQQQRDETYLDSLAITMELLFLQEIPEDQDDIISHKLQESLADIELANFSKDEIRKATQLAMLKGMKDSTQQQHLMTPETVSLIVGYLAEKVMLANEKVRVFDPASGTANLLTTVLDRLDKPVEAFASEVDPTLIQLAVMNANLQEKQIEFFHQDSIRPFLLDPVDLVVADLPVGYYPDDFQAANYELKADEGHSYAHHLFIEQGLNYTKPGGYMIYVVPDFLFDSDQSDKLHRFIQEYAHIVGVIRLPESVFKSEKNVKSILLLQKKSQESRPPKQPLLAQMPSFKNTNAMADILGQMNNWFQTYNKE